MAKKRKRTIVGSPLTPAMLDEMEIIPDFPPQNDQFQPEKNWVNTYRVWTCHGYRKSGNTDQGVLKIERLNSNTADTFTLKVSQQIIHDMGQVNLIHADILCKNDQIASPLEWSLESEFIGPDGNVKPELTVDEKARNRDGNIKVKSAGFTYDRQGSEKLSGDWCLFEAIQRFDFNKKPTITFDLYEGLSLLRENHQLFYRGLYPWQQDGKEVTLHWFQQLGQGVLPYEYWLDENHRMIMAVTLSRVYILDEQAGQKMKKTLDGKQRYYQRKLKDIKGGRENE